MSANETVHRMGDAVTVALADLRAQFDIETAQWHEEADQWADIERKLLVLVITAYKRNHSL